MIYRAIEESVWHILDGDDFPEGDPAPILCGRETGTAIIFPGSPQNRPANCPACLRLAASANALGEVPEDERH